MKIPDQAISAAARQYSLLLTGVDFDSHDMDTRAGLEEEACAVLRAAYAATRIAWLREAADQLADYPGWGKSVGHDWRDEANALEWSQ